MRVKNTITTKHEMNHKGNYEISVSFDMFGNTTDTQVDREVMRLETMLRQAFNLWKRDHRQLVYARGNERFFTLSKEQSERGNWHTKLIKLVKVKNVRWNQ